MSTRTIEQPPTMVEKVLTPFQSQQIIAAASYAVGGVVADPTKFNPYPRTPAELIAAWGLHYHGSPFDADPDYVDVLRIPWHPVLVLAKPVDHGPRPWPTYPRGVLPTKGAVPVWLLQRTRVPPRTALWRLARNGERHLLSEYRGAGAGWTHGALPTPPTFFLAGTWASWHGSEYPAELVDGGTAVELIAPAASAPAGFEQLNHYVARRIVPLTEVEEVYEPFITCRYRGVLCRILYLSPPTNRLQLLSDDPVDVRMLGAYTIDIGAFGVNIPDEQRTGWKGTTRTLVDSRDPIERAFDLLKEIVKSLQQEPALVDDPAWDTCSVLASVTPATVDLTAYRYTTNGQPVPTAVRSTELQLFRDLHHLLRARDGTAWRVCIVKIARDSRFGAVKYLWGMEAEQWAVAPADRGSLAERLRPRPAAAEHEGQQPEPSGQPSPARLARASGRYARYRGKEYTVDKFARNANGTLYADLLLDGSDDGARFAEVVDGRSGPCARVALSELERFYDVDTYGTYDGVAVKFLGMRGVVTCFVTGQDDWARAHGFVSFSPNNSGSPRLWLGYALRDELSNIYETIEDKLEAHGE